MSGTSTAEEQALVLFAKSVVNLLKFWPALRIAISQGWGSVESRTSLAEDIVDLFYTTALEAPSSSSDGTKVPDQEEVEDCILNALEQSFQVALEDNSEVLIARDLSTLWKECITRVTTPPPHAEGLIERFDKAAEKAQREDGERSYAVTRQGQAGDEADDDSSDEEGSDDDVGDEEMQDAQPAPAQPARAEPVVDEDGFELVQKKGRRR